MTSGDTCNEGSSTKFDILHGLQCHYWSACVNGRKERGLAGRITKQDVDSEQTDGREIP